MRNSKLCAFVLYTMLNSFGVSKTGEEGSRYFEVAEEIVLKEIAALNQKTKSRQNPKGLYPNAKKANDLKNEALKEIAEIFPKKEALSVFKETVIRALSMNFAFYDHAGISNYLKGYASTGHIPQYARDSASKFLIHDDELVFTFIPFDAENAHQSLGLKVEWRRGAAVLRVMEILYPDFTVTMGGFMAYSSRWSEDFRSAVMEALQDKNSMILQATKREAKRWHQRLIQANSATELYAKLEKLRKAKLKAMSGEFTAAKKELLLAQKKLTECQRRLVAAKKNT